MIGQTGRDSLVATSHVVVMVEAPHGHGLIPGAHDGNVQALDDGICYPIPPSSLHNHLHMHGANSEAPACAIRCQHMASKSL